MDLACDDLGQGTPVVCLPPFSLDRSVMAGALEPVLARRPGLRRIYVDLPGHGESPAGPATSEHVLAAVSGFLQSHLGGVPALLTGWSYGGYIAAALARRWPAAVAGLLLICAVLAGAGHYLPLERPGEFGYLVEAWLGRCAPSR